MASKTYITKLIEELGEDGIKVLRQDRTLYADQFTDEAPRYEEDRQIFNPGSMKDVFEHYQPSKTVELQDEDDAAVTEEFSFTDIKDFEDERLIKQSKLLTEKQAKIDTFTAVARQIEKSKAMRSALREDNVRDNLKNALKAILAELKNAEK